MKRLFLFDIDGTLMRGAGPHHGDALVEAIRQVLGVETSMDGIPVHGMLDQDILAAILGRAAGESLPEIIRIAQEIYPRTCPDLRDKVLPGVRETLEEIAANRYPAALVTGNLTQIGWTKMERAGLRHYFQCGAFAEMAGTRAELAATACKLAGFGTEARITLIGDSPSDVEAAKANGFRCVAVATGMTSRESLEALGADVVLDDLSRPEDRARLIHG